MVSNHRPRVCRRTHLTSAPRSLLLFSTRDEGVVPAHINLSDSVHRVTERVKAIASMGMWTRAGGEPVVFLAWPSSTTCSRIDPQASDKCDLGGVESHRRRNSRRPHRCGKSTWQPRRLPRLCFPTFILANAQRQLYPPTHYDRLLPCLYH
ncbi:hypothetical protein KIN20_002953 [Parelaphostrongylus tenuis]|uniref:Uncharacterized protein n=1 Tax=Parelaphostrongylus tenuis TaxID=148309 RepID=A0AAD5MHJ7_PARTN|nr:hypothetical protein KIN20_002953 [Parelaphostrongylus tenuis]